MSVCSLALTYHYDLQEFPSIYFDWLAQLMSASVTITYDATTVPNLSLFVVLSFAQLHLTTMLLMMLLEGVAQQPTFSPLTLTTH
jgi:hypothetical protein